jgi:hypothetical protein
MPSLRIPAHQVRIVLAVVELQEWRDFQLDWSSTNYSDIPSLRIPAHQVKIVLAVVELEEWNGGTFNWTGAPPTSHTFPALGSLHIRLEYFWL